MRDRTRLARDLVLVGGGHAHALVLRAWGMDPLAGARLTLISPEPTAPYTGMLPGHVAGHYARDELDIDLVALCRHAGARLVLGAADGIDPHRRLVRVPGRPDVPYDVLSVDVGITGAIPAIPGLAEHGVPAKPLGVFADRWDAFVTGGGGPCTVIGGGVAGVELALAMAHRLGEGADVTLIEAGTLLPEASAGARRRLREALGAAPVAVREETRVLAVEPGGVRTEDGFVTAALTVGAAGAAPHPWLAASPITGASGEVVVDETLRSVRHAEIFAAGDCAAMAHAPRKKAGVYAVRQAPVLAANLRAALMGQAPVRSYQPQRDYLKLVSTGARRAAFDRSGVSAHGPLIWALKDTIDRRFMDRLADLAPMTVPARRAAASEGIAPDPLCGGCGAKAGRQALTSVLAGGAARDDVLAGPGGDAGALRIGSHTQLLSTDTIAAFADDPYLVARVAAIHALNDGLAAGGAPRAALVTLTLPRMTPRLQARTVEEAMGAIRAVLDEAGAALIGGHTAMGDGLSVGLTVTALRDDAPAPPNVGDGLFLTKPLGTGTVLAGGMTGTAGGPEVAGTWDAMATLQLDAAAILRGLTATDVTGFGLANHALVMLDAHGLGADLDVSALPFLPGALALTERGVRSSLYAENVAAAVGRAPPPEDARTALLYDPQTAGGFLVCAPSGHGMTEHGTRIGTVTETSGLRARG